MRIYSAFDGGSRDPTKRFMSSWWAIRCVWWRYFSVYQKNWVFALVTTFVEPLLYLVSFGFGVGGLIGMIDVDGIHMSYRQFIFAGVLAQAILFQGFFEAAYGSFVRMYYQKIFQAMAMTPITLSEILWGELLWDASKATISVVAISLIGVITGDFKFWGAVAVIPIAFFCAMMFAGMGLLTAAKSRSIEDISYPQFLLVFPMFLFCGVFFPISTMPPALQVIAWLLPLTSVTDVVRALTLGLPLHPWSPVIILAWLVFLVRVSRRAMVKRLIK